MLNSHHKFGLVIKNLDGGIQIVTVKHSDDYINLIKILKQSAKEIGDFTLDEINSGKIIKTFSTYDALKAYCTSLEYYIPSADVIIEDCIAHQINCK